MQAEAITYHPDRHTDGANECLNCGESLMGRYCSACGQSAHTPPVTWHYIWHEIPHSVWHLDRGILFSLQQMVTRPGYAVRDFLAGKRVQHYRPLALLLLLAAVVVFLEHILDFNYIETTQEMLKDDLPKTSADGARLQNKINTFVQQNQTLVTLISIPGYAFGLWVFFKRLGVNYPQMLVTQTFLTNFGLVLSLVMVLMCGLFKPDAQGVTIALAAVMVGSLTYTAIVLMQLFKGRLKPVTIVVRSILAYFFAYAMMALVFVVVGVIFALVQKGIIG